MQATRSLHTPLVRVAGLSATFGAVKALSDVELDLTQGELLAVAGEPGAGKTTLIRCLAGDVVPAAGTVLFDDAPVPGDLAASARRGIAVAWQDVELSDNLDVAGNVLLGHERPRLLLSQGRFHAAAGELLRRLKIPIADTTRLVGSLTPGERQLVAVARAVGRGAKLLLLDEPTAPLAAAEAAQVEALIETLRGFGTTILLASRDVEQMFRIADRIVVLHHGRLVAELDPRTTHPDDLVALMSGQQVDSSARRQLTRLHGLADRLVSADPSSSLTLILSALGASLGTERLSIHVVRGRSLVCAAALGFTPEQVDRFSPLPLVPARSPIERAASGETVVEEDVRAGSAWAAVGGLPQGIAGTWSLPVAGPTGVIGVITAFRIQPGAPERDELDLMTLYAGYAASAVERDRLLHEVTARNRVLETIREMLETLAGPAMVGEGLALALASLRRGLRAREVALLTVGAAGAPAWRAHAGPLEPGQESSGASAELREAAKRVLGEGRFDGSAHAIAGRGRSSILAAPFAAAGGRAVLLAAWSGARISEDETALVEDGAHSLRLALEREEAALAHQEAAALRRLRELQRGFLSRLSHELRTPLTAIRGYASTLRQPDVTWDRASQDRFLARIAAESARLGRLVDDLLDFSAIESGVMRLQRDWCEIPLVVEAAVSCLPSEQAGSVTVSCDPELPTVWADHDRLEQVFVNLLGNALRHNPSETKVSVTARPLLGALGGIRQPLVEIRVSDDGGGFPAELAAAPFESARRHRSPSSGAGLGLSIARGIVDAHGGVIGLIPVPAGTEFMIRLPVEAAGAQDGGESAPEAPDATLAGVGADHAARSGPIVSKANA